MEWLTLSDTGCFTAVEIGELVLAIFLGVPGADGVIFRGVKTGGAIALGLAKTREVVKIGLAPQVAFC